MNRVSIENKLRKLLQNCGNNPVLSPVISIFGTTEERQDKFKHKHIGLPQAIQIECMWLDLIFGLQAQIVPGFKKPEIIIQYIEEMNPRDLIFTGVSSGEYLQPGSVILIIHGDESGNLTYGGFDKPGKWFSSKKLVECISTSRITLGRTILPICNGHLVNKALSGLENIIQVIGNCSGDILEENGGMTRVLKDETHDSFFEFRTHIFAHILLENAGKKTIQSMNKTPAEG